MSKFLDKTGLDTFWAKIKSKFQTLDNLVTSWGSTPSDTKYPSEKLVKDSLDAIGSESKVSQLAFSHYNDSAGYHWFKLAVIPAQNAGSYSTVILTGSCGSWGSSNKCEFTLHISVRDSIKFVTTQIEGKLPNIIRFELYREANNSYSIYARIGSWEYVAFISYILCLGYSSPSDVSSFYDSVTGTLVANSDNSVLLLKIGNKDVGSSSLPVYAKSDGTLSPINIDEYYCWNQPTAIWTDLMEVTVWYVKNQCNNEILGSVRRIELDSRHPSLCYLLVNLPELIGVGRYRFTLEFEIINFSGQLETEAYGVLILVPPTGYWGETILAECVYDSNGKAKSRVMNQIHIPPQGYTYRHKLYVDGHTYRVVKTM